MTTVTATYVDAAGTAHSGSVEFRPVRSAGSGDDLVTQSKVTATLDETGSISVDLVASDAFDSPAGLVKYQVRELLEGLPEHFYLVTVTGTSVDLSDLQPPER